MKNEYKNYLLAALLLVAVIVTYSNHFHNSLHFDDAHVVQNNIYIRNIRNIPLFFKDASTISSLPANQAYRPVVVTSLALDYYMGKGLRDTFYFHLSMFVLFLVQGIFMYLLYLKIFDNSEKHAWNKLAALCAVAWYLLHPANAETINYISARSDTLSTLFGLISLVLFIYSPVCRKWLLYLIPLTIAVLAKPIAVVFVLLLMVYIYFFGEEAVNPGRRKKESPSRLSRVLKKSWPSLLFCVLLMIFTKAMTPPTFKPGGAPFFNYVITQPYVILHYFTTFFLPISLSADTDWGPLASTADLRFSYGIIFLALLLYTAFSTSKNRRTRPIAFGILWFLITLLPTSLFPLAEVMNDHRIFLPYVGLMMSVSWTIKLIFERIRRSFRSENELYLAAAVSILLALSAYAYGTYERNKVWKTDETLWRDVTEKSPKNGRGLMNYGEELMSKADYAGAEKYFNRALQFTPNYSYLHINLAVLKEATGRYAEAEQYFRNAISLSPNNPVSYFYYGRFLKNRKRYDEAVQHINKVLELSSAHLEARYLLMSIYFELDDFKKLREVAEHTLLVAPDDKQAAFYLNAVKSGKSRLEVARESAYRSKTPEGFLNLSLAYFNAGQFEKSIEAALEALKQKPDYDLAYNNICSAYNELRQWDKAIEAGAKAIKLNPNNQLARNNYEVARNHGKAINEAAPNKGTSRAAVRSAGKSPEALLELSLTYYRTREFDKSINAAKEALKLKPDYDLAYNNICAAYNALGQWDRAIEAGEKAVKLNPKNQLAQNNLAWARSQKALLEKLGKRR